MNARLPPAAVEIYRFQMANTFCWFIFLGFPMVLYLQSLGASAMVLGLAMGAAPLFTVLQIPAAGLIEKVGYRRFVFRGWATRNIFGFGLVVVVLTERLLTPEASIRWILIMLAGFCIVRGFASGGVLPWFTQLIPANVRGRYLAVEQMLVLGASTALALGCALLFRLLPGQPGYAVSFMVALTFGVLCLFFLRRIPDCVVENAPKTRQPIPWRELAAHRNFRRIIAYHVVTMLAWTGGSIAIVPLTREEFGIRSDGFMLMQAGAAIASILALWVLRSRLDAVGSKPMLQASIIFQVVYFGLWALLALRVLPLNLGTLVLAQLASGGIYALYHASYMRLIIQTVPEAGRSFFFAISSVTGSLALGVFPVAWGAALDRLRDWRIDAAGVEWNGYGLLYLLFIAISLASVFALRRIEEKDTLGMNAFLNEVLVKSPSSVLANWVRRRPNLK